MSLDGDIRPRWHRIERVLATEREWQVPEYEPGARLDPLSLAAKLVALAKRYDQDAREARQAAASCRAYASALRAGEC